MTDQIEIQIPNTRVNEESTFVATCYFRDRQTKASSTPTTIHYKVVDVDSEQTITDWTSVSTPAASNTITITSAENEIIRGSNIREMKMLLVKVDDGLSTQLIQTKQWRVENLEGIT